MNPTTIGDATFWHGDCLEVMNQIPDNSIETIITDPPYGLRFMGKKWDYDVPIIEIWKECLRVLKPGGTALVFAGSRTQHRMAINIEDAGFILKDCIMWLYGTGFPKATDISKQIDKKLGTQRESLGPNSAYRENHLKNNSWREGENRKNTALGSEFLTSPGSKEAREWDGWKSHGLKPAYEPILVVMKPNNGSYAENALKYGVAGLNIDGGRIEVDSNDENIRDHTKHKRKTNSIWGQAEGAKKNLGEKGRYPANIILDEEAAALLDQQSGTLTSGGFKKGDPIKESDNVCMSGKNYKRERTQDFITNSGGASRFFYCAKASPAERNAGCDRLPLNEPNYGKNMSSSDKGTISGSVNPTRNNHPTVKPISLMEYLCNLTKIPTGGTVLDPFMGSGTTAMAACQTRRKFIGIEKEKKYFDIAVKRYKNETRQLRLCDL